MEAFLSFDARILRTLTPLVSRPGFLTREFLEGRRARFAGRAPGWAYRQPRGCPEWPPEESFFDTAVPLSESCADLDELCDPLSADPCCDPEHRCSGEDRLQYRCS